MPRTGGSQVKGGNFFGGGIFGYFLGNLDFFGNLRFLDIELTKDSSQINCYFMLTFLVMICNTIRHYSHNVVRQFLCFIFVRFRAPIPIRWR